MSFNRKRFEAVENVLTDIQREYGRSLDMSSLLSSEDLFLNGDDKEMKEKTILSALDKALKQVHEMRNKEGRTIHDDIVSRVNSLSGQLEEIRNASGSIVTQQKEKMEKRVNELLDSVSVDEQRLAQEVALLADRADISEELLRIQSHLDQFKTLIELNEPTGKRLSFLLQELGREINTVVDGVDYHFITDEEFRSRMSNDEFAETEDVHGCMYGTLKETIENAITTGEIILFEVDVKGAMSIKSLYPEQTVSIFVLPPSMEDLRERLINRGTDSEERITKRLERLKIEIGYKEKFDFNVINDDVQRTTDEIIDIIHTQNKGVLHVS